MTDNGVMSPEVYSVSVKLRALKEVVISQAHGYQVYGLLLNVLRMSSQSLAEELHGLDGAKPFTVSPLQGRFGRAGEGLRVIPESEYSLRFTFLKGDVFAHFLDGAMKWGDDTVELGSGSFQVEEVNPASKKDPSTDFQSYEGILNGASTWRQIELQFLSPTAFRSRGHNVIFPEPALVFGSYLTKWQAFSPVKIEAEIASWLDKIMVSRYRLQTHILDFGSYQEIGFTGHCRYEIDKDTTEDVVIALNTLADFAYYAGTGAKTTMGMGQTKRLIRTKHLNK